MTTTPVTPQLSRTATHAPHLIRRRLAAGLTAAASAAIASRSSAPPEVTGAVVAVTAPTDRAPANLQAGSTVLNAGVHRGPEDLPLTGTVVAVRPHGELLTVDVFPQNFGAGDTEVLTALLAPPAPLSLVQISGPGQEGAAQ